MLSLLPSCVQLHLSVCSCRICLSAVPHSAADAVHKQQSRQLCRQINHSPLKLCMEAILYSVRDGLEDTFGKVAPFLLLLLIQQMELCSVFLA